MKSSQINRRDWLKGGLLATGSFLAAPYLGFSKNTQLPLTLDQEGNAIYSPFFKEYIPENPLEFPALQAKLNANENPYGPSPKALEAFKNSAAGGNRYAWKELLN